MLVHDRAVSERSRALSERLDALASALRAAGVEPGSASRLLESAAAATLSALALELLLEESELKPTATPAATAAPAEAAAPGAAADDIRLAA